MQKLIPTMHIASRLFAGSCMFLAVLGNGSPISLILQLLLMILITGCLLEAGSSLLKATRLLVWIVIPTVVLHALFTPGEYLFSLLPITYEGIRNGIVISLHLSAIFVAAIQLSRLLSRNEWYRLLFSLPYAGKRLPSYVFIIELSFDPVRKTATEAMSRWRSNGKGLRKLVTELSSLPGAVMKMSRELAQMTWDSWYQSVEEISAAENRAIRSVTASMLAVVAGILFVCLNGLKG